MIKILPEILSNKIAAGEVVERPASVVKELLENSLDADSTRILIELEKGGRSLIRISDNGIGMNRDDAMLAIERYATSKIFKDADLFSIRTLGFRGEALPSIASVSRFTLTTREKTSDTATEVYVEGGKLKKVSETGAPPGTMIAVKQLFFNTPARRKFLKTVTTEMGHIADTISTIAMGWPNIQFILHHNGRPVHDWYSASESFARIADILGKDMEKQLHPVDFSNERISVRGWISSPRITRSTSRRIYTYVNGRSVRDRVIQHALFQGYADRLMKGQFPVAALFIDVPFDQVDVNVHPTKSQIRFAQQNSVHDWIRSAVSEALSVGERPAWNLGQAPNVPGISEPTGKYGSEFKVRSSKFKNRGSEFRVPSSEFSENRKPARQTAGKSQTRQTDGGQVANQHPLWIKKPFGDLKIIGQLHNTYILCESEEGLVLLDQHAAHERIRYEQLQASWNKPGKSTQGLLTPISLDLSYAEADTMQSLLPELEKVGFRIEPFGGATYVVKSIPAILSNKAVQDLLMEMIEKVTEVGIVHGLEKTMEECLILMACHETVRGNQKLTMTEMRALLEELDRCKNPNNCPHGRPVWISWSVRFLEKSFRRTA